MRGRRRSPRIPSRARTSWSARPPRSARNHHASHGNILHTARRSASHEIESDRIRSRSARRVAGRTRGRPGCRLLDPRRRRRRRGASRRVDSTDMGVQLRDLGSKAGTWVEGERIVPRRHARANRARRMQRASTCSRAADGGVRLKFVGREARFDHLAAHPRRDRHCARQARRACRATHARARTFRSRAPRHRPGDARCMKAPLSQWRALGVARSLSRGS